MTVSRDPDRIIRAFLDEGLTELPDRVYDAVRSENDRTRQRVVIGPWRTPDMNSFAKVLIAAAAVVVVAFVGINLLPRPGGNVGGSPATPSPGPSTTTTPSTTPSPTPVALFPPAGPLEMGKRHTFELEGQLLTLTVPTADWKSNGEFGIDKTQGMTPEGAGFIFWKYDPNGVFSNPCARVKAPVVGPRAADMAAAITTIPGIDVVTPPTAVTVGGKPAQFVAIKIRNNLPCVEDQFYLWYDSAHEGEARYASQEGQTIRSWITDIDGKRIQIDGETFKGAGPGPEQEIQQVIDSIQFE
jgi:hypothetical protein